MFDFFGTLTPSRPKDLRDQEKAATANLLGIPSGVWAQAVDAAWVDRILGTDPSLREFFGRIAKGLGFKPSDQQLDAAVEQRLDSYVESCAVRPDVLGALRSIRELGLRIGLVSDCGVELPYIWSQLPVAALVDAAVFSCEEHLRKPAPELFRLSAARLGVGEQECLYIGDGGGSELSGAAAVGMRAVLFQPPDWADHDSADRAAGWDGAVVASASDVPRWLGEQAGR